MGVANRQPRAGALLSAIWRFTWQIVDKQGNPMDLQYGNSRGKGIAFVCRGSGNNRPQIYGKTRNQILHPRVLIWSGNRLFLT